MKPGDIVTLGPDKSFIQLLSESIEKMTEVKSTFVSKQSEIATFRRGDLGIVLEINQENLARVKIFYNSNLWWGNISDMLIIGDTVTNCDKEL